MPKPSDYRNSIGKDSVEFGTNGAGKDFRVYGGTVGKYIEWIALTNTFNVLGDFKVNGVGVTSDVGELYSYLGLSQTEVNYYISDTDGLDTNDGLTPDTAFKTIQKLTSTAPTGSVINVYLKSGDTFTAELYITDNIKYKAYGVGEKPIVKCSIPRELTGDWTDLTGNIWQCDLTGTLIGGVEFTSTDVGFVYVNGNFVLGTKRASQVACVAQGEFYANTGTSVLEMYSVGNPATFYDEGLEVVLEKQVANITGIDNVEIDGLEMGFCGGHVVYMNVTDGCKITNNFIHHAGGAYLSGTIRYGNGIEFWKQNTNALAKGNYVLECYDAGITTQGTVNSAPNFYNQENITVEDNIVDACEYALEFWGRDDDVTDTTLTNIYYRRNTCRNSGYGWGYNARTLTGDGGTSGSSIIIQSANAVIKNVFFTDNILDVARDYIFRWKTVAEITDIANIIMDNNKVVQSSIDGDIALYDNTGYANNSTGWTNYKTASSKETYSSLL